MSSPMMTFSRRRERGFSLLELMIAVTIGLVLTIVVAQLFLGSRRSYATTDDVSRMQENIRYTYQVLTRSIHLAGFKTSPNVKTEDVFNATNPMMVAVEGGGTASDSFTLSYQGSSNGTLVDPDNTVLNCLGAPVAGGITSMNAFTVAIFPGGNGRAALGCNGTELIPDVENMQVLYGIDTNRDLVADIYVPANNPLFNVDDVRSMRVALLFQTPNIGVAVTPDTQVHTLNGVALPAYNDSRIRRVVTLTVNLRNRTP